MHFEHRCCGFHYWGAGHWFCKVTSRKVCLCVDPMGSLFNKVVFDDNIVYFFVFERKMSRVWAAVNKNVTAMRETHQIKLKIIAGFPHFSLFKAMTTYYCKKCLATGALGGGNPSHDCSHPPHHFVPIPGISPPINHTLPLMSRLHHAICLNLCSFEIIFISLISLSLHRACYFEITLYLSSYFSILSATMYFP